VIRCPRINDWEVALPWRNLEIDATIKSMMRNTTIPRLFWCFRVLIGLAVFAHEPPSVRAQGFAPAEAAGHMSVADGLEVRLVAAEPLIRQPVAIEFDDRGRLWVIQYMQYPNPAELKRVAVDRYSRTVYDRIPDPPPRGPKGADRITILEDTDGDGRADHSRDFVTGLNLASGLAFGYGGVFVIQVSSGRTPRRSKGSTMNEHVGVFVRFVTLAAMGLAAAADADAGEDPATRIYENRLKPIANPRPILADFPQFVEPVREVARFEAPTLIDDPGADLDVRAWRFSYNARGIVEVPNRLRADRTAVIVVHPWGIDDGQGWRTPEPAGVAFQCTPAKNKIVLDHAATVINPFLKSLRSKVRLVAYSLPGIEDAIRKKIYRSSRGQPGEKEREQGRSELKAKLASFAYHGQSVPASLTISAGTPMIDYFKQFPGLDAGPNYEGPGFWELPIPVMNSIDVDLRDVVIYDGDGYPALRGFLKSQGIRHVLLAGYNTDMCVCSTTAGYIWR
jgi:hypothetical protein